MTAILVGLAAAIGLAVGSFLNVVIWRVPRRESVVRPASACPGCGHLIRPRDNVPLLGWLMLRGRCRDCRCPISPRYPAVEAGTAGLFAGMAASLGPDAALPAFLYLCALAVALALIDIDTHRLPDALTLPAYPASAALLALGLVGHHGVATFGRALAGGVAMFGLYAVLRVAYPAGMGFGDVKLAGVLGLYTAWVGWGAWSVGLFLGFFYGGLFGVVLIALGRGGRKTRIPFGPFMLAGALSGVFAGEWLVSAYLSLTAV